MIRYSTRELSRDERRIGVVMVVVVALAVVSTVAREKDSNGNTAVCVFDEWFRKM